MAAWISSNSSLPVKGAVLLVAVEVLDRVKMAFGWIADGCWLLLGQVEPSVCPEYAVEP